MNEQAHHAVRAARNVKNWGRFAARRYCEKRGVHPTLYRLARQLEVSRYLNQGE